MNELFVLNSLLLGVGLAMDAFSVSLANGLNEPGMSRIKMGTVAGVFAFFQALMPMLGWACVHTVVGFFHAAEAVIPYLALVLLCWIGGKMLVDGIRHRASAEERLGVSFGALLLQGTATSIDALSVGFTIADYSAPKALCSALMIAAVTFLLCFIGLCIGKRFGNRLADKATVLGGGILIFIGVEIFVTHLL